jgi:hypothetical protein
MSNIDRRMSRVEALLGDPVCSCADGRKMLLRTETRTPAEEAEEAAAREQYPACPTHGPRLIIVTFTDKCAAGSES